MKNYKKYIGCLSLSVLTLIGCEDLKFGEKNFWKMLISNELNIDSVFNKKVYAEQALAETYHSLPDYLPMQGRLGYGVLEMLTDLGDPGRKRERLNSIQEQWTEQIHIWNIFHIGWMSPILR